MKKSLNKTHGIFQPPVHLKVFRELVYSIPRYEFEYRYVSNIPRITIFNRDKKEFKYVGFIYFHSEKRVEIRYYIPDEELKEEISFLLSRYYKNLKRDEIEGKGVLTGIKNFISRYL